MLKIVPQFELILWLVTYENMYIFIYKCLLSCSQKAAKFNNNGNDCKMTSVLKRKDFYVFTPPQGSPSAQHENVIVTSIRNACI